MIQPVTALLVASRKTRLARKPELRHQIADRGAESTILREPRSSFSAAGDTIPVAPIAKRLAGKAIELGILTLRDPAISGWERDGLCVCLR